MGQQPVTVLIADQECCVLRIVDAILRRVGFKVLVAQSRRQLLSLCRGYKRRDPFGNSGRPGTE